MPRHPGLFLLLSAALMGATSAVAGDPVATERPSQHGPIKKLSACLDPQRARSWALLDSNTLYVDAGRRRYLLQLDTSCPELAQARSLSFLSAGGVGRICGNRGEQLRVDPAASALRDCRIGSVHILPHSAPRIQTSHHFTSLGARESFFEARRGGESPSYDVSRRSGD